MKKNLLLYCYIVILLVIFGAVLTAAAQGLKSAGDVFKDVGESAGANTYEDPQTLIGTGINAALTLVGLIFLILMIYAGYLWLTARGEEEPITKAKKIITSSIIGFVLVASAYSITFFVGKRFENGSSGNQQDLDCIGKTGQGQAGCDTCAVSPGQSSYECTLDPQSSCQTDTIKDNYCNGAGQKSMKCCQLKEKEIGWTMGCPDAEKSETPTEGCDICGYTPLTEDGGYACRNINDGVCDAATIKDNYCWGTNQEANIKCCKLKPNP